MATLEAEYRACQSLRQDVASLKDKNLAPDDQKALLGNGDPNQLSPRSLAKINKQIKTTDKACSSVTSAESSAKMLGL